MRLQAIKLSGFKSFVDPTTVSFPSNLCAVVGPNGCGKSNIIDAVRWVMGETSAKTLRGESMSDVIFSGSNTRKPVGQASIELVFDNSQGRLTGEYAAYTELSIKRQVTRDGTSNYFLNNQKCRRKDITDIFLGTGLGPRSYSIIEQGMISQLIEARPEDLRMYIEEAAGISRYKERRKETERRISHTRENLDRLADLREELGRQLQHLERQSRAALRYTELKAEERTVKSQLQALKWMAIEKEAMELKDQISRLEVEFEARMADERRFEAEVESLREALAEKSDEMNEVQRLYYNHGTEIARIEESIQHQQQRNQQLVKDLNEVRENIEKVNDNLEMDRRQMNSQTEELDRLSPEMEKFTESEKLSVEALHQAEERMNAWQQRWDAFNESSSEANSESEVQRSRINHLEESIERLRQGIAALRKREEELSSSRI
ncbi:MAG: AAA family ATPase, partial [Gammaproteobacteria bacterium]|nr:AAA family ATPase [Gammaproteobacteria bacterium]